MAFGDLGYRGLSTVDSLKKKWDVRQCLQGAGGTNCAVKAYRQVMICQREGSLFRPVCWGDPVRREK